MIESAVAHLPRADLSAARGAALSLLDPGHRATVYRILLRRIESLDGDAQTSVDLFTGRAGHPDWLAGLDREDALKLIGEGSGWIDRHGRTPAVLARSAPSLT